MLITGRRFWPTQLRKRAVLQQTARLAKIRGQADAETDKARQIELDLLAAAFPLDRENGTPMALYPTRLGNLFASYETYPTVKYGIDGVFFWPRLLVVMDKDLRAEVDSAQAMADGALNSAFAFAVASPVAMLNAHLTQNGAWVVLALSSVLLCFLFYLSALPQYAQFGVLFCAVFDQYRDRLDFGSLVEDLDRHMADVRAAARPQREVHRAAWRFLRWHRYRRSTAQPGCPNETIVKW
jgi:hypothetical protein